MMHILQKYLRRTGEAIREWLCAYGRQGLLLLGMLTAVILAFEGGFLVGRDRQTAPVVIEKPVESCAGGALETGTGNEGVAPRKESPSADEGNAISTNSVVPSPIKNVEGSSLSGNSQESACAFVGSRNSDKYHLPKCSWAKRIKPENRVCFSSAADAESKGYGPGCVK